jgi:hypothetical protein
VNVFDALFGEFNRGDKRGHGMLLILGKEFGWWAVTIQ